jgi:nucleoside-diphosphate-sugar epimerase
MRTLSRSALAARFAVDLRAADAGDEDQLTDALAGCAAAVLAVRSAPVDRKRHATVFCRAAARAGVRRLVYLSSASVHGDNPPAGTSERARRASPDLGADALAFVAAERQFFVECKRAEIAGYALRPAVVYGPRSPLVAEIAEELRAEKAWLLDRGEGICNAVCIDNLVAAVRLCLKARLGAGEAYLIGDAETLTWREFVHAIARNLELPVRRIRSLPQPPAEDTSARAALQQSTSKLSFASATRLLGYTPPVPFAEGIRRSCVWWRFTQGEIVAAA